MIKSPSIGELEPALRVGAGGRAQCADGSLCEILESVIALKHMTRLIGGAAINPLECTALPLRSGRHHQIPLLDAGPNGDGDLTDLGSSATASSKIMAPDDPGQQ